MLAVDQIMKKRIIIQAYEWITVDLLGVDFRWWGICYIIGFTHTGHYAAEWIIERILNTDCYYGGPRSNVLRGTARGSRQVRSHVVPHMLLSFHHYLLDNVLERSASSNARVKQEEEEGHKWTVPNYQVTVTLCTY